MINAQSAQENSLRPVRSRCKKCQLSALCLSLPTETFLGLVYQCEACGQTILLPDTSFVPHPYRPMQGTRGRMGFAVRTPPCSFMIGKRHNRSMATTPFPYIANEACPSCVADKKAAKERALHVNDAFVKKLLPVPAKRCVPRGSLRRRKKP